MKFHRLVDASEILQLKGKSGYVLNVTSSGSHLHHTKCSSVRLMNPKKRGGVYYAPTLEGILNWLEKKRMEASPCKVCLQSLSYTPRPEKLKARY